MKSIFTVIGIITIAFFAAVVYFGGCNSEGVSRQEFEQTHKYLNLRIDTIQQKLDTVKWLVDRIDRKVDTIGLRQGKMYKKIVNIEGSIDTLKIGQLIIYDDLNNFTSQQQTRSNWAENLIEWLR